jgi:3-hydroxyacyl-CoA dehydrogenase
LIQHITVIGSGVMGSSIAQSFAVSGYSVLVHDMKQKYLTKFNGPIEIADFGGLDTWQRVFDNVALHLDQSTEAPAIIRDMVEQEKLGAKSGEGIYQYEAISVSKKIDERDRRFIQLGKIKEEK